MLKASCTSKSFIPGELSPTSCTCHRADSFWGALSGYSITLSCVRGSKELLGLCPVQCPGCGLLLPLQQPEWDCMGLCLQRLIHPSTSKSRGPPAILGCCQEPRPAFDSLRRMEIHVPSPYTCVNTEGTGGGTCWRPGCHPELGQTHRVHVPEETRDS